MTLIWSILFLHCARSLTQLNMILLISAKVNNSLPQSGCADVCAFCVFWLLAIFAYECSNDGAFVEVCACSGGKALSALLNCCLRAVVGLLAPLLLADLISMYLERIGQLVSFALWLNGRLFTLQLLHLKIRWSFVPL